MDSLYFIRIIIEGRDNFSRELQNATARVRAEIQKLKNEIRGLDQQLSGVGRSQERAASGASAYGRALGGSRNATERARREQAQFVRELDDTSSRHLINAKALESHTQSLGRLGRGWLAVGNAMRGARRSLFDLQPGVRDVDRAVRQSQGALFDFAYKATRGFSNFAQSFLRLNSIAAALAPLIFTLIGGITNLAAALFAVGAAATVAAGVLGGALIAGITQLIPVVGVLAIAFHRLSLIFQANSLITKGAGNAHNNAATAAKSHREAIQRLADAQYSLSQSYQTAKNQTLDLRDAERNLVEVRRQAARDIVDQQNNRIDAVLAEKDATLSLMEAQKALADLERQKQNQDQLLRDRKGALDQAKRAVDIARAQGDPAQLSAALQQLGAAQSNYGAIAGAQTGPAGQDFALQMARARLGVQQATQRQKESEVTMARAIEDANRAQKRGVEGTPAVIQARRSIITQAQQLAAAEHDIALRLREVRDASSDLKTGAYAGAKSGNPLSNIMERLTPTEKNTLTIVQEFTKLWNKATQPLTDAIVRAVGRALKTVETLFKDKQFMAAFQTLADAIGKMIESFAKFLTSPEQKKFFEQFALLAADNLPTILSIFEKVIGLVERVGIAAAPVFERLLGGANKFLGKQISKADAPGAGGQNGLETWFTRNQKYLDKLLDFVGSFVGLIGALISAAAPAGLDAISAMTKTFNRWAAELRTVEGKKAAGQFFENAIRTSGRILDLLGKFIALIFHLTSGPGFDKFLKFLGDTGFKSLEDVGTVFGGFFAGLVAVANAPGVGAVLRGFIDLFLAAKLIPGVGPAVLGLTKLFSFLGGKALNALGVGDLFKKVFGARGSTPANPLFVEDVTGGKGVPGFGGKGGKAAKTIEETGEAAAKSAGRFARLKQVIFEVTGLLLPSAALGVGGRVGLVGLLGRAGLAGVVGALGIGLGLMLRKLPLIGPAFDAIGGVIGSFAYDLTQGSTYKAIASGLGKVKDAIGSALGAPGDFVAGVFGAGESDHKRQLPTNSPAGSVQYLYSFFNRLIGRGVSPQDAADYLRRTHTGATNAQFQYGGKWYEQGGAVSGVHGQAIPIVAHAGEWVLNAMQQMKLAQALRKPISWVKNALFGGRSGTNRGAIFGSGYDSSGSYQHKPMLANWGDQQYDASGNQIYGGTYFVETPLGQWVQLARQTIAKIQRSPGWLPRQLLQSAGFQGATKKQLSDWSTKFFSHETVSAGRGWRPPGYMPQFAEGGVVGSPAAMPVVSPAGGRGIEQNFEIHSSSPNVDIDYVMRVAKVQAEASF